MPDRAVVVVRVEVGTPTTGLWCDRCQLPSGVSAPLVAVGASGVTAVGEVRQCVDCGARLSQN